MKRSLRSWLWRVPLEQEVDEEIAFHLEMRARELVARGMDPTAARQAALGRLGDLGRVKRTCVEIGRKRDREMRLTQWVDEVRHDVTFAIRQLRAAPGFTLVAALTLALGIGANSAMFALADAALLRPLPFAAAERLVLVEEWGPQQSGRSRIELLDFRVWKEQARTFEAMAAVWVPAAGGGRAMRAPDGTAEAVPFQTVTWEFFDVLGVRPIAGRTFQASDESPRPNVVVLSEGFWRRRFGADPDLIGSTVTIDRQLLVVIGVVPASFQFVNPANVWTLLPMPIDAAAGAARGQCATCRLLQVVARLRLGVSPDAAQSDTAVIAERLAAQNNERRRPRRVAVTPLRDAVIGRELRTTSLLLLGVVGLLLSLCCTTIASLLIARAGVRRRELAVRGALGAGRSRIVRQLLTESLVLATAGGLAGAAVGVMVLKAAPAVVPAGLLPTAVTVAFDARIALFCAVVSLGAGVLFGVAPAWNATGAALAPAIGTERQDTRGAGGRVRDFLVAMEVAIAVLVLCGAGLLLRTLLVVEGFERGYRADPDRVLTASISVPALVPTAPYPTRASLLRFFEAVEEQVATVPGVTSVAFATTLPFGGAQIGRQSFSIVGEVTDEGDRPQADHQIVSRWYFETLSLPIVAGRSFTEGDTADSVSVCIVNEALVRRFFRGRNPIGARLSIPALAGPPVERQIVGVAKQVKGRPDERDDFAQIYVPNTQQPWPEVFLVVGVAGGSATAMAAPIRKAVAVVDDRLPVNEFRTLDEVAATATGRHRFRAIVVAAFAAVALGLAMAGVFGVLVYAVEQRRREFGVRIALGATPGGVLRLACGSAARVVTAGAVVGLVAAAAFAHSISAFLFGVEPLDPTTFVGVGLLLVTTAGAAIAAPAIRATRVDPAVVFREG